MAHKLKSPKKNKWGLLREVQARESSAELTGAPPFNNAVVPEIAAEFRGTAAWPANTVIAYALRVNHFSLYGSRTFPFPAQADSEPEKTRAKTANAWFFINRAAHLFSVRMKKIAIGITGGIACGKSTVARMFHSLGAELIDADEIVGALYRKPEVVAKLVHAFGSGIAAGKNKISRASLANLVFSDARKLKKLNSLVHPFVVREIKKKIARSRKGAVVVDVPLLFEANLSKMFDFVIVVRASRKAQIARLRKRGISLKDANLRLRSQMPLREKVKLADFVISTEGTKKQTFAQVQKVYSVLGGCT